MFIYLIVNRDTGKYYVGQHKGNNLKKYLQTKLSGARYQHNGRSHLFNAMRKYPQSTLWSIHALRSGIIDRKELDECEREVISFLKAQDPEYGYNICRGGEGRTGPLSQEHRKKLSQAFKDTWKQPELRAKILTEQRKQRAEMTKSEKAAIYSKVSKTLMGHAVSDEVRVKVSLARKGKSPLNKGKPSPKTSVRMQNQWADPAWRKNQVQMHSHPNPLRRKRFCKRGHNKDACGKLKSGACRECSNNYRARKAQEDASESYHRAAHTD